MLHGKIKAKSSPLGAVSVRFFNVIKMQYIFCLFCSFLHRLQHKNICMGFEVAFFAVVITVLCLYVSLLSVHSLNSADYHFIILISSDKNERNTTESRINKIHVEFCLVKKKKKRRICVCEFRSRAPV